MIDTSQLDSLSRSIAKAGREVERKTPVVVTKSAKRVTARMRKDAKSSKSFAQIARTITEDLVFGSGEVEAEIGPDKSKGRAASIANIAYYGSSKPGGATVADPKLALDEEEPRFMKDMAELAGFEF